MNVDIANLSVDLRRISYWIYRGRTELADKFLNQCKVKYRTIPTHIGNYTNVWDEVERIQNAQKKQIEGAERALTLSRVLEIYSRNHAS